MSNFQVIRMINNALLKLSRAVENGGIDPISGYDAESIESYLQWEIPVGYDSLVDAGIKRIYGK